MPGVERGHGFTIEVREDSTKQPSQVFVGVGCASFVSEKGVSAAVLDALAHSQLEVPEGCRRVDWVVGLIGEVTAERAVELAPLIRLRAGG